MAVPPSFSITERSLWALEILAEEGFRFDLGPTFFLYPQVLRGIFRMVGRDLDREVDLVMQYQEQDRETLDQLKNVPVFASGAPVLLAALVPLSASI